MGAGVYGKPLCLPLNLVPKSVCARGFKRPKLRTSEFGVRKGFNDQGANREDGRPNGASHPSCSLDLAKGF